MIKHLLILFLSSFLIVTICNAQAESPYYRDQLRANYREAETDIEKVINGAILSVDLQLNSIKLSKEILDEVTDIDFINDGPIDLIKAYKFYHTRNFVASMQSVQKAIPKLEQLKSNTLLGQAYFLEGVNYNRNFLMIKARNSLEKARTYFKKDNYIRGLADVTSARAIMLELNQQDKRALNNQLRAKELFLQIGATDMVGTRSANIARLYWKLERYDEAISAYKETLAFSKKIDFASDKFYVSMLTKLCNTLEDADRNEEAALYKDSLLQVRRTLDLNNSAGLPIMRDYYNTRNNERSMARTLATASEWETQKKTLELENEKIAKQLAESKSKFWTALSIGSFLLLALGLFNYNKIRKKNILISNQKVAIEKSLKEKDTLLREIHHRVKNNLQVVSSLLRIQSSNTNDETAVDALKEGQSRVQSMSLIHQDLYQKENLTSVSINKYFERLSENLFNTYNISRDQITLTKEISQLNLDIDTVVPLGLILNELLTNALKYGFPNDRKGEIKVTMKQVEQELFLEVRDNGIGLPEETDKKSDSFGLNLVEVLSGKLDAGVRQFNDGGAVVQLRIKEFILSE